ncbi:hypothetical protein NC652_008939 [Populus alba x Populus x berolinensis]|uniref:Uncharacterized protein n=1 Tax=Populus alba x Populus x berolinensis TaxID=444605 RepID=A0AAD6R7Q7_9ROSI|nr:hypothetical protein NC652_008939 [Populus alba x Populus x berolinensis]KAJ7003915.1 hypothetical protein NC653_008954 [Populus alba x Populus x berolinensis]
MYNTRTMGLCKLGVRSTTFEGPARR